MPVYKPENSPYYYARFELHGRRVHKSTKAKNKKDAELVERQWREQIEVDVKQAKVTGNAPITLDVAAGHYWLDRGQYHANSATTQTDIQRLIDYFGKDKRLDQFTDADVKGFVNWRRQQTRHGKKADKDGNPIPLIANATVNRSGVVLLKGIFNHCTDLRHVIPNPPKWKKQMLEEPQEIVRELDTHEAEALDGAVRKDYALWFEFARITGLRRNETLIKWADVNIFAKRITTIGKRRKPVSTHVTPAVAAILKQCKGHHPVYVFTFVCQRPNDDQIKGQRYPITPEGAKTQWRRLRRRSGVQNFRFHDIRHDVGTKVLRQTGNLKIVQKILNHSKLETTLKYAHVLDEEVAAALTTFQTPPTLPTTEEKVSA
ncbi:tyrosine-type recombinase/integrase [Rhizobium laguerreae]|uniref:site-specific integrase n=1 Tax=Rhizobium laguerreae TaxID=1076926 RepID=UPI001C90584E|nr:tyrosine-type recombinase/integrase [Rhizobium laguerreae]MBY3262209.1 tyrosine-type recombinase/integrase [Rhizobium laguerreae]MBY3340962.1 tyrosine-type recombinase/integrase [Rhizobium laguerreae]